jgi:hypothetical protein
MNSYSSEQLTAISIHPSLSTVNLTLTRICSNSFFFFFFFFFSRLGWSTREIAVPAPLDPLQSVPVRREESKRITDDELLTRSNLETSVRTLSHKGLLTLSGFKWLLSIKLWNFGKPDRYSFCLFPGFVDYIEEKMESDTCDHKYEIEP